MVVWTVWLCLASRQNVIKLTPAPAGLEREGEGDEGGREMLLIWMTVTGSSGCLYVVTGKLFQF